MARRGTATGARGHRRLLLLCGLAALAVAAAGAFDVAAATPPRALGASSGCRDGRLPDRRCTPGAAFAVGARTVCVPGYAGRARDVPASEKRAVYAEYGIFSHRRGQYEVDHLIPLELGGSNSIANLWPQPALPRPGFHEKDRLENTLHDLVCSGQMSLGRAQRAIATDWVSAFYRYVRS